MSERIRTVLSGRWNLRVCEVGNPEGLPVIVLHGGPGAGSDTRKAEIFDLDRCRVFFADQRGTGGSLPAVADETDPNALRDNTLVGLIDDVHLIKEQLGVVAPWVVAGNSFGTTLALSYSMQHPQDVSALLLWGVFLCRTEDLQGMFQPNGRASRAFPDAYQRFLEFLPVAERSNPFEAYSRRCWAPDRALRENAAWEWVRWNRQLYYSSPRQDPPRTPEEMRSVLTLARLVQHYFTNGVFLSEVLGPSAGNNQLIEQLHRLPDVPVRMVHGDVDMATTIDNAYALSDSLQALPRNSGSSLTVVPGASHSSSEPGYIPALKSAAYGLLGDLVSAATFES
jgi:proline iminopeptidase